MLYPSSLPPHQQDLYDLLQQGREYYDHRAISQVQSCAMRCKLKDIISAWRIVGVPLSEPNNQLLASVMSKNTAMTMTKRRKIEVLRAILSEIMYSERNWRRRVLQNLRFEVGSGWCVVFSRRMLSKKIGDAIPFLTGTFARQSYDELIGSSLVDQPTSVIFLSNEIVVTTSVRYRHVTKLKAANSPNK